MGLARAPNNPPPPLGSLSSSLGPTGEWGGGGAELCLRGAGVGVRPKGGGGGGGGDPPHSGDPELLEASKAGGEEIFWPKLTCAEGARDLIG